MRNRIVTFAVVALALAAPASALAAPQVHLEVIHAPKAGISVGHHATFWITVSNTGNATINNPVHVDFTTPAGLKITKVADEVKEEVGFGLQSWTCSIAGNAQSASCAGPDLFPGEPLPVPPGEEACIGIFEEFGLGPQRCRFRVTVAADPDLPPGTVLTPTVHASATGAGVADVSDPIETLPPLALTAFDGEVLKQNGEAATQAGSHPHSASTDFSFTSTIAGSYEVPTQDLRDAAVELPPGLVGNPQAYPTCTAEQVSTGFAGSGPGASCQPETQIGVMTIHFDGILARESVQSGVLEPGETFDFDFPIYNVKAQYGTPALFGVNILGTVIFIYPELRTGDDYGLTVLSKNAPETLAFQGLGVEFWGVPADPGHDVDRWCASAAGPPCASNADLKPFLSLPTSCTGSVLTSLEISAWQGGSSDAGFLSHAPGEPSNTIGADGCNAVDFSPTLEARPTTNVADAPSGLDVDLHIPQNENPTGTAEAHLKDASVTLPEGMVVNPSAGNGLDGCSPAEFGLTTPVGTTPIHTTADPGQCPDAAKLGTVEVDSPLVDHPLFGAVFLADPYDNPFESLLALYISVDDPETGLVVKLAGRVNPDPSTGQLTAVFEENPQQPFEDLKLHFFGGALGALRTPAVCGNHTATSLLVPWTAPEGAPATPSDNWSIAQGPNGGACVGSEGAKPNAPTLDAGAVSPIAGAHSPLVVNLRREDGSQNFSSVTVTPPPGLTGKLVGIPYCPGSALEEAAAKSGKGEEASPSCPASSRVGTVNVAAGAGPAPYNAQGTAYLTGPYKGAPISLAIITPATAGPFDLGTVVTKTALYIDPKTAQITAAADPIPSILQGIPLDVRSIQISLDRPSFSLNPTSCDPMAFTGSLVSTLGQTASLSSRFQLGECTRLGLEPKMSLRLSGGTRRRAHPSLTATLEPRAGDSNLKTVSVALPPTELLDQSHIGTVCTRVQFAADQCPAASIYGQATVITPLLDYELTGPVYLRSSDNPLPDLVTDLRGPASQPIKLEAAGKTDTVKGALRNTFDGIPDAPFTKLVLTLPGGSKGLIQNSRDICSKTFRATIDFEAHNGLSLTQRPAVKASCPKKKKSKRKSHRRGHRRAVR